MTFIEIYLTAGLVILGLMTILWGVSLILKNSSIVDVFWGLGFVVAAWLYFGLTPDGFPARKWLIAVLVTIWGLRLSLYLLWRNWGEGEDYRYRVFRKNAGKKWWWQSLFKVFWLQGAAMWLISAPVLAAQISPSPNRLTLIDYTAILVWGIGFFFEAVGDWQLARFKANPANQGKLLTDGIWRYTRHPNYFGDAAQWFAHFLIAAATPGGYITIFSPIIMTFLLVRISGIALLEKTLKNTKPGYQEYIANTSAFVPWLPGKAIPKE